MQITVNGQKVTVSDNFRSLSPEQQDATVDEIAASMGASAPGNVASPSTQFDDALASASAKSTMFKGGPVTPIAEPEGANLLDRGQSFAQGVIDGLPVVGPTLTNARTELDALIAQIPGGMTPDQVRDAAAERKAFLEQHAGNERLAGEITGAVVPLTALGMAAPAVGTALGMSGGLGAQVGLGALSSAALSGADTFARGGTAEDAVKSAVVGGSIGGAAPLVLKGAGMLANAVTGNGANSAANAVGQALQADGLTPQAIDAAASAQGMGSLVLDQGPNLQSLAGGIASVPGKGQTILREAIEARAKDAPNKIRQVVQDTVGKGQAFALAEDLVAGQKAAADPLYEAIRNLPMELEGNIKFVADTPLGQAAFKQAREWAANDGYTGDQLTVQIIDYAKQSLDDVVSAAKRSGQKNAGRQADNLARMLTSATDAKVPGYKLARDAFAGPAVILDALEEGQGAFTRNLSPEAMEATLKAMSTSEKEAFMQGAAQSISDLLGNSANDVVAVRQLVRKPYNEAKLRLLIGDDATNDLLRAVDTQFVQGQSANVVSGNAETARRKAMQGLVDPEINNVQPPSQSFQGLFFSALNAARAKLRAAIQPGTNKQMAELLASSRLTPAQIAQLSRAMQKPGATPIAPAAVPLLTGTGNDKQNAPLRIVVDKAGSYFPGAR